MISSGIISGVNGGGGSLKSVIIETPSRLFTGDAVVVVRCCMTADFEPGWRK